MKKLMYAKTFVMKQHVVFKTTFNICIYYNMYTEKSIINFNKKMIKNTAVLLFFRTTVFFIIFL